MLINLRLKKKHLQAKLFERLKDEIQQMAPAGGRRLWAWSKK
jgi:hypothetical protein